MVTTIRLGVRNLKPDLDSFPTCDIDTGHLGDLEFEVVKFL